MLLWRTRSWLHGNQSVLDHPAFTQHIFLALSTVVRHWVDLVFCWIYVAHICAAVDLVVAVELHRTIVWHFFDTTVKILVLHIAIKLLLVGLTLIWQIGLKCLQSSLKPVTDAIVESNVVAILLIHQVFLEQPCLYKFVAACTLNLERHLGQPPVSWTLQHRAVTMDVLLLINFLNFGLYLMSVAVDDILQINHTWSNGVLGHVRIVKLNDWTLQIWRLVWSPSSVWALKLVTLVCRNDLVAVDRPPLGLMAATPLIFESIWLRLHRFAHETLAWPDWAPDCPLNARLYAVLDHAVVVESLEVLVVNLPSHHHLFGDWRRWLRVCWHLVIHDELAVVPVVHVHLLVARRWHRVELLAFHHSHYLLL